MRDIPDYFWEWTELDFKYKTGMRLVNSNVPNDILKKLVDLQIKVNRKNEYFT